jgi:hypothetical protein
MQDFVVEIIQLDTSGELPRVAKRFYNIGTGKDVSTIENRDQLVAEIFRLVRCQDLLEQFYRFAEHLEVEVCKGT